MEQKIHKTYVEKCTQLLLKDIKEDLNLQICDVHGEELSIPKTCKFPLKSIQ